MIKTKLISDFGSQRFYIHYVRISRGLRICILCSPSDDILLVVQWPSFEKLCICGTEENYAYLLLFFWSAIKEIDLLFELLCWKQVENVGHWLHIGFFFFFFAVNSCFNMILLSESFFCFWVKAHIHKSKRDSFPVAGSQMTTLVKSGLNTIVVKVGVRKEIHTLLDILILSGASRWQ